MIKKRISTGKLIGIGSFELFITYLKGQIQNSIYRERNKPSTEDILEDLKERITDLEIEAEFTEERKVYRESSEWETYSEAAERAQRLPPLGWVVPGLIPEGSICNLVAVEKAGKSFLATQIARDYSCGVESKIVHFNNGFGTSKGASFIYDAELTDDDILHRNYVGNGFDNINRCPNCAFDTTADLSEHLMSHFSSLENNVLVVVDNVTAICPNFNGSDIKRLKNTIQQLQTGYNKRGYRITFMFVHHTKAGKSVFDDDSVAGFKEWDRLGTIRICLGTVEGSENTRLLGVKKYRRQEALLKENEVLVLKKIATPYLHFEYDCIENLSSATQVKESQLNESSNSGNENNTGWALSEKEKDYILNTYEPGKYSFGKLAGDILEQRGLEKNKKDIDCLKQYVKRFFKKHTQQK